MKKTFLLLISLFIVATTAIYGQTTETEHFIHEKKFYKSGSLTIIRPKNEVNHTLKKEIVRLMYNTDISTDVFFDLLYMYYYNARAKPFQDLIDKGTFTKKRMKKLAEKDKTAICTFFDETGIVSYVEFWVSEGDKSLFTDKELYLIYQQLKKVKYDLSLWKVYLPKTASNTNFRGQDLYNIPYKELRYK